MWQAITGKEDHTPQTPLPEPPAGVPLYYPDEDHANVLWLRYWWGRAGNFLVWGR